jgi:hypothetical protein
VAGPVFNFLSSGAGLFGSLDKGGDGGLYLFFSAFPADVDFYRRRTPTPDWVSRYGNLYAYILSFGWRYRF